VDFKFYIMKSRIFSSFAVAVCLFVSFSAFGWQGVEDKITVYKGKDKPMLDSDMNFCVGEGYKCADLTTSQLTELIRVMKED
jgi:hypothetical protein